MRKILIKPGVYYDSVKLLLLSKEAGEREGILHAMVAMATATNLEILSRLGWSAEETAGAGENDLLIALEADSRDALDAALEWLEGRFKERVASAAKTYRPKTLRRAIQDHPSANLVQISIPGAYAFREAKQALEAGKHVMLFSDNVPVEEEVALKKVAVERGLLMMGPDCGTAILNGACLGFANVVPKGPVGIVAASGTGAQEVSCLLARLGVGVSQVIGTGGRDLSREVDGRMMRLGLRALAMDPETRVVVLVSKPPESEVGEKVLVEAGRAGKPVIVNFLGEDRDRITRDNIRGARTLEEAVHFAYESVTGQDPAAGAAGPCSCSTLEEKSKFAPGQRYLRGLFVGGTLADEAMLLLKDSLGTLYSNGPVAGCHRLDDSAHSRQHTVLDLGADEFTVGRAHPMIDPTLRNLRIVQEAGDPETAVLLLDVVLGYGSHADPAGETAEAVREARAVAERDGRYLAVVASVCGTEGDPQDLKEQEMALGRVGARVFASNAQACRFAAALLSQGGSALLSGGGHE